MNAAVEEVAGEVLDAMPAVQPQQSQALATQHANPYLGMIESVINRGGSLEQVDKFLDLQIKWESNEARKAYVAAMSRFKTEPMEILKRKLVSFATRDGDTTSYRHAELADVTDVVVPAMGKHGLSHRWDVTQNGGTITVDCIITHELGHSEKVSLTAAPDASGKKNAIQQVASAVSYLQRYTLLAATGMATKGMDDDSRTYEDPAAADELDPKDSGWIDAVNALVDYPDYLKMKEKMTADYGGVKKIPEVVRNAFNLVAAKTKPRD